MALGGVTLVLTIIIAAEQQSWATWLIALGVVAAIIIILWAIDRIFKPKKYESAMGNALMTAEVFFRPSRQKVIEAKQQEKKEEEESGDPPETDR